MFVAFTVADRENHCAEVQTPTEHDLCIHMDVCMGVEGSQKLVHFCPGNKPLCWSPEGRQAFVLNSVRNVLPNEMEDRTLK